MYNVQKIKEYEYVLSVDRPTVFKALFKYTQNNSWGANKYLQDWYISNNIRCTISLPYV